MRYAILLLLFTAACGRSGSDGIDLERMIDQVRYDAYEASPLFSDGRVMRTPPDGSVPREHIAGRPAVTEGLVDGSFVTSIPIPVNSTTLETGREEFDIYCAACHGAGGFGGSMVAMNMRPPLPPSLVDGRVASLPVGSIFETISHGSGRMPSFAANLRIPERWAVIAYLTRVLRRPHPLTAAERLDSIRAEVVTSRWDSLARVSPAAPP